MTTPAVFVSGAASETARIARLLAIADPDSCSDVNLAQSVAGGLRPAAVTAMAQAFGGNRSRIVGPIVLQAGAARPGSCPGSTVSGSTRSAVW